LPQTAVFQQLTNVLQALAEQHPLLILLDDLQWFDTSSISLLFHLGRRLANSRILIVGAYRAEDVALKINGRRHPLQSVLAELKRTFGDVWLALDEDDGDMRRQFVDAYLDAEPNQFDQGFRQAMVRHTGGHPLFTVELLRSLQEREYLVQNEAGEWIVGTTLAWDRLPARVEAVIAERIGRLERELRELLQVASVEGETFTGQVLAQVQELTQRQLLQQLSLAMAQQHRLVQEQGTKAVSKKRLFEYRFAHALFQRYLYNELSQVERHFLHGEVGQMLENLYGEEAESIAGQLAHHFLEADMSKKALHYLQVAGYQAAEKYAHEEAIVYFSQALELLPDDDVTTHLEILLAREKVLNIKSDRDAQAQDLAGLEKLLSALPREALDENRAAVLLRQADFANVTSDFAGAISAAKKVIALTQESKNKHLESAAHMAWGLAVFRLAEFEPARHQLTLSLQIAQASDLHDLQMNSLRILGLVAWSEGKYVDAVNYFEQGLELARNLGNWLAEGYALNGLGIVLKNQGRLDKSQETFEEALHIFVKMGHPHGEAQVLNNLGDLARHLGTYARAKSIFNRALTLCWEMNEKFGESIVLNNLARISYFLEDYETGCQLAQDALTLTKQIGNQHIQASAQEVLANCLFAVGERKAAIANYQEAMQLLEDLQQFHMAVESQAGLARACFLDGKHDEAKSHVEQILDFLKTGSVAGTEEPLRISWICYQVLQANEDARANAILEEAYHFLQEKAPIILDDALRHSFLENIPFHRDIIRAYEQAADG